MTTSTSSTPTGASCWICLEEGPDEEGKPLIRNCSCRGQSGFSHVSCIIKYAQKKTLQLDESKVTSGDYMLGGPHWQPWKTCPNCNQDYNNELLLELAESYLSFTKESAPYEHVEEGLPSSLFPCDPLRYVDGLYHKLNVLSIFITVDTDMCKNAKELALTIISLAQTINAANSMKINSSMGKRFELFIVESMTYIQLGSLAENDARIKLVSIEEGFTNAIKHYESCQSLSSSVGYEEGVNYAKSKIAMARNVIDRARGVYNPTMKNNLPYLRAAHERVNNAESGFELLNGLIHSNHGIESQRLVAELLRSSRRAHGTEHDITKKIDKTAELVSTRSVSIFAADGKTKVEYHALHYDGDKLCVKGPISRPRKVEEESTIHVSEDEFRFYAGTPVVCHGLQKASHLIGEIGDVRSYDEKSGRYEVHFEDESYKPCRVKHANLRIIFELPDDNTTGEDDEDYEGID